MMDDPGGTHSKSTILSRRMFMLSGVKIVIFAPSASGLCTQWLGIKVVELFLLGATPPSIA